MFEGNLFQRLLLNDKSDKFDHLKNESVKESEEVHISLIGPFVWSPEYFISSISRSSSFDDSASGGDSEAPQLKPNEDATEPVKKKGFDSQMSSSNPDDLNSNKREKRKLATARMTANEVSQELSKANVNPHMLIAPHIYGESFGAGASASQPFKITVHPQVLSQEAIGIGECYLHSLALPQSVFRLGFSAICTAIFARLRSLDCWQVTQCSLE